MRFLKCLCYWLNKCCAFSTCSSMNYPKHTCQNKCVYKYRLAAIKSSKVVWVLSQLTNVSLFIPALMNPFSSSALNKSNVSLDGYHSDFLIRRAGMWLRYFAILLSKGMLFFSMLMTSLFFHSHVLKDSTSGYSLHNLSVFPAFLLMCSFRKHRGMIVTARETV